MKSPTSHKQHMSMQPADRLSAIIGRYDAVLMDLWGVIHDGSHLYPGAHETLEKLRAAGKQVVMVSNAPRRAHKAAAVLTRLGVEPELYKEVVTSGELGYRWLSALSQRERGGESLGESPHPNPLPEGEGKWGKRYFYIGPGKDADVLEGLDYQRSDDIKQCDFVLNVGFGSEEQSVADWQMLLRAAATLKLPMLCLNPDFEVVKISGERFACAGVLAADYERLGGAVKYFGKPFAEVYDYCLQTLAVPKARVLAIGDGIATDIAGAVGYGIDAVLVTGGIVKKDVHKLEELCTKHNAVPNYVMPQLMW